jgi:translation initiation factor 2 alpha subunit (eIF-2alpha)
MASSSGSSSASPTRESWKFVRKILEKVCSRENAAFSAIFDDGNPEHLTKRYGGLFEAYEQMAIDAISHLIQDEEVVTVLADRYTPPQYLGFEKTVREAVNDRKSRLAVANLVRLKSSATDGLQMVDLLLGAIAYDFRRRGQGEGVKQKLTDLVQELHGVPCYRPTGRDEPDWYKVEFRGRGRGRRSGTGRRGP